jgi:hypothetical protein
MIVGAGCALSDKWIYRDPMSFITVWLLFILYGWNNTCTLLCETYIHCLMVEDLFG